MKKLLLFSLLTLSINSIAQIPVDDYRKEIKALKSENQIFEYWEELKRIDQEILLKSSNQKIFDSISISNMVRTALLFEIHGQNVYKPNITVPILNLSHNYNLQSNINFWPIIEICKNVGGIIESFGGEFPTYPLESVSLTSYNYSLLNEKGRLPYLRKQLSKNDSNSIVKGLLSTFEELKRQEDLKIIEKFDQWKNEPFQNFYEDGYFELVRMSDNCLYFLKNGRLTKLKIIENVYYDILILEKDPFNWHYKYSNDGKLSLFDQNDEILIKYSKIDK